MVTIPGPGNVGRARIRRDPGVQASGPSPGEITGQATEQLGERLFQAGFRQQTRHDAVQRSQAITTFNREMADELRRLETEADLADPQVVESFGERMRERQAELIEQNGGVLADSRTRLQTRLEGIRGEFAARAAGRSVQAQRRQVNDQLSQSISGIAASVQDEPGTLEDAFASLDGVVDDMAPALSPEEERAHRIGGRSQIVKTAFQGLVDRGAIDQAEEMLTSPGIAELLGPDDMRRMRSRITVQRVEQERTGAEFQNRIRAIEAATGPLSREQKLQLAGIQTATGSPTLAQKVAELEAVTGKPASDEQIAKMAGALVEEGNVFGSGLTGRSLEITTDLAQAFAVGLTSPEQERQFMSAVTQLRQPTTFQNPDTGLLETRRPELPPFVEEALRLRQEIEGGAQQDPGTQPQQPTQPGAGQPLQQGAVPPGAAPQQPGVGGPPQQRGVAQATPQPGAEAPEGGGGAPERVPSDQTVFDMAGLITGPVPTLAEGAARTPVLGAFVPSSQIVQARNVVPLLQRDLVRVLQNNPRFAEGERRAIEEEIDIGGSAFDTPQAFRNRLIAVDRALEIREQNAFEIATGRSGPVGREERVQAMNVLQGIQNFRRQLGVPPRVKSPEEVRKLIADGKLKPGDQFVDPEGNIRQVP